MTLRERQAEKIIGNPGLYKVCCGCESILCARARSCPTCHAYRFEESADAVIKQAKFLSTREPETVVPEDLE